MLESIPYAYVIVLAFVWRIISQRKGFSFRLFNNIVIKKKTSLYIEKIIMFILPVSIAIVYSLELIPLELLSLFLNGVILVDFLLQYLFKSIYWIDTDNRFSKELLWWGVLAVVILIIV